ncbi:MAG: ATP:cob(I)alamin adenosyltransferase [Parcubacteria group bacterium GW2011_GWA1_47_11]|uniref:Corrinoid adenosyltransferase n=1 Tax=Candidatus Colwellbacteria bacterium GWA2_46_10 TaxID=1797684 RepID=A0A1G1YZS4_9BACT|nr:MAG: ATP:cob(I)alamin adenosyltransferase [Parcubacteria group bacterium GW2011_GWA2_46_10]KKU55805.1 MAG: ATP:cob(I)alamin adenosyltransferase [Parcubacteria group bacterium GW2011_GWA1_47_11]OGY56907.1 MAG: ATP:cob(I)alamin adenosyltransferase [Candidatus Colwellbacteria bacterium GWA2_46_10]
MLYTGKGDKGTTKVLDSKERFSKGSDMAEALGSLDELNSFLGLCKFEARHMQEGGVAVGKKEEKTSDILREVQENLFIIQAQVAGADKRITKPKLTKVERVINLIEKEIPPLKSFSIAGGTELSALLDIARTVARRTERRVVTVKELGLRKLPGHTLPYLNRLSSLLFALARLSNHRSGIKEENPSYK